MRCTCAKIDGSYYDNDMGDDAVKMADLNGSSDDNMGSVLLIPLHIRIHSCYLIACEKSWEKYNFHIGEKYFFSSVFVYRIEGLETVHVIYRLARCACSTSTVFFLKLTGLLIITCDRVVRGYVNVGSTKAESLSSLMLTPYIAQSPAKSCPSSGAGKLS